MKKINGIIGDNFWQCNPEYRIPDLFNELYKSDKSKNKESSSTLMWCFYLYSDPNSKFSSLLETEKKNLIQEDYLKDKDFKWKDYKEHLTLYENLTRSPAMKQMMEWERLMNEKTEFMRGLSYDEDTYKDIEDMLLSNEKLFKAYDSIMVKLNKEDNGNIRGGSQESPLESGEI